jgi:hypothetical protein
MTESAAALTICDTPANARRTIPVMSDEKVKWFLMSGNESMNPENILKLFEQIKGRQATAEARAELMRTATEAAAQKSGHTMSNNRHDDRPAAPETAPQRKVLPSKWGRPASGPIGTGIGLILGDVATKAPKKNA